MMQTVPIELTIRENMELFTNFHKHDLSFANECATADKLIKLSVSPSNIALYKLYKSSMCRLPSKSLITRGMTLVIDAKPTYQLSILDKLIALASNSISVLVSTPILYYQALSSAHSAFILGDFGYSINILELISILQSYGISISYGSLILSMRTLSQLNITQDPETNNMYIPGIRPSNEDAMIDDIKHGTSVRIYFNRGFPPLSIARAIIASN